jgi:hypothetical protein
MHAIELDTSRSTSRSDFARYVLWPLGRMEEALHQLRIEEENDPLSPQVQFDLGWLLISVRPL